MLERIAVLANGDARAAYNTLEALVLGTEPGADGRRVLSEARLEDVLQKKLLPYDKSGEEHFNLISALHKSVRNSDPDAALYWLARMLESGEDPLYLARRMVRMASEDIGLAEPGALAVTIAAKEAFDFIGPPEGNLALAQAAVYLSLAPKSNALYTGYGAVQQRFARYHRGARSAASKKCGHGADGKSRLRKRLSVCARRGGKSDGHDVPAGKSGGTNAITSPPTRALKRESGREWKKFEGSRRRGESRGARSEEKPGDIEIKAEKDAGRRSAHFDRDDSGCLAASVAAGRAG